VSHGEKLKIEIIIDKNILEAFINDGELYYVTEFTGDKTGTVEALIKPTRAGGQAAPARKFVVTRLEVHELNSIWK
jgi:sucrose-6-phosphate hydrolase SacC (GH32 family)